MSYNNNFSYFNAPTSNNEWWGAKETKQPIVFEERGIVKIDYNNQPYAQNYMQNYAQSMILPSENRSVDPIHPRHEVLQGTVTQLFSAFGYVNDNIIFSKSDVTGPMVKVGDRVAVDATYQPNNPTKYKGERVCKIDDSRFSSSTSSNLSKMKPLSKDISTRIDIPLPTYRPEMPKFDQPKKPEPKPIKKFDKPLELSTPHRTSIAKEVAKQPEPKRFLKAVSPIDLTRSERSSSSSSSRKISSYKSPPKSTTTTTATTASSSKRKLKRSSKQRSPSRPKSSSKLADSRDKSSDRAEKPPSLPTMISSSVTTVSKIGVEKLAKQQESFSLRELDCASLKFRCKNLQPPNQFFHASLKYQMSFPLNHPMKLGNACHFKVMDRKVTSVDPLTNSQLHRDMDPDDADSTFSAKVMLLSTDDLASFYKNTLVLAEEFDGVNKIPITKAIKFLVGSLGQNKEFAFGGAWSPSLDGVDPDNNPQVLINTAIRTCKNLTGIDLSSCSSWPKFLELHYYRPLQKVQKRSSTQSSTDRTMNASPPGNSTATPADLATSTNSNNTVTSNTSTTPNSETSLNNTAPSVQATNSDSEPMDVSEERFQYIEPRMETVVYYVPDIWNCVMSQDSWNELKRAYQEQLTSLMCPPPSFPIPHAHCKQDGPVSGAHKKTGPTNSAGDNGNSDHQQQQQEEEDYSYFNENEEMEDKTGKDGAVAMSTDEQPSHFSSLNVDNMKIVEIKKELERRKLSTRGVMDQLKARLKTALEKEESDEKSRDGPSVGKGVPVIESKPASDTVLSEAEKAQLKEFYVLPDTPHIVVHHNMRYHGNKMRIKTMSLHSLLSYYDMKLEEATFEVALFAKQFLEMLRRDSVFNIYKSLVVTPDVDFAVKPENPAKKPKLLVTTSKRTVDRPLLFSCTILDREKSGKIALDELKSMIEGLGICLSSDQLTSLLSKIPDAQRMLHYRVLTDKEIDDNDVTKMLYADHTDDLDYIRELAMGNKALFEDRDAPLDMHPCDLDEIDRLKNELDKSERCRQTIELRFAELREEAEKQKAVMASQTKEISKHKDQAADYRARFHREQDRGDHYKKELDKLHRDLKIIDKMSGTLGRTVLESLERFKKAVEPKLPTESKSKSESRTKPKGGRASSTTSSSSVAHSVGRAPRKSGTGAGAGAAGKSAETRSSTATAGGTHSGIIAGNDDEDLANITMVVVTSSSTSTSTSSASASDVAGTAASSPAAVGTNQQQQSASAAMMIDLDTELLGGEASHHHDISLDAEIDVDDVLLMRADDELCCLLQSEDDLDMLQCVDDDDDDDNDSGDGGDGGDNEQESHEPLAMATPATVPAFETVEIDDDDEDEYVADRAPLLEQELQQQLQREREQEHTAPAPVATGTVVQHDLRTDDTETDDMLVGSVDDSADHCQDKDQLLDTRARDSETNQDQDQEMDQDFDLSRPSDYEIIILDETE